MSNPLENKKVLVTGATGFIGRAIADRLFESGVKVIGTCNEAPDRDGVPPWQLVLADVLDFEVLADLISRHEIDIVFHLAAYSIVKTAAVNPIRTFDVNVMGTVNILEAARVYGKTGISVIVASSDKAYGDHDKLPYEETFPLLPTNVYDVSKAAMDLIAQTYAKTYGLDVVVTRCSNVYGPGDDNYSRLIPNTICRLLGEKEAAIYEDVYSMEREFIYIDDVVDAYIAIASEETPKHVVYNIGQNKPMKICDVIDEIYDACGRTRGQTFELLTRSTSFQEIQKQCISSERLQNATGWKPKTSLKHGLEKTVRWYQSRLLTQAIRQKNNL
jgi:CDP-glucose 4,6-dehydratase